MLPPVWNGKEEGAALAAPFEMERKTEGSTRCPRLKRKRTKKGQEGAFVLPPAPRLFPCLSVPIPLVPCSIPHPLALPPVDFGAYIPRGGERQPL